MPHRIAIVGGGIMGFTAADRLARIPGAEITLLDRDIVGQGASARSAGLHFPLGGSASVRAMARFSQRVYEAEARRDPDGPIRPLAMRVHLPAASDPERLSVFLRGAALSPLARPGPLVRAKSLSSWIARGAHRCDVPARIRALVERLRGRIVLREGCRVAWLEEKAGGVRLALSDGSEEVYDAVLLAPGPWATSGVFAPFTRMLGIRAKRIVAFHVDAPASPLDAAEFFLQDDAFLLPLSEQNRWLFSYTCDEWGVSPDRPGWGITARHREAARAVLARAVPDWAERLSAGRVFCDAYSPNRVPIVTSVSASGRIVLAGAANGAGYRLAPAMAERAATLLPLPDTEPVT